MDRITLRNIPEFKQLFESGRLYLGGKVSICQLNGTVSYLKALARFGDAAPAVHAVLDEWCIMVNRRWNEWHMEKEPLSEEQFVKWLKDQLVFDKDD
jgi:hypothetical protein